MRDESTKQAAQEYLAARLTEEDQIYEEKHNMAMAVAGSPLPNQGRARDSHGHIMFLFIYLIFFGEPCGQVFLRCLFCALISHRPVSRRTILRHIEQTLGDLASGRSSTCHLAPPNADPGALRFPSGASAVERYERVRKTARLPP